MMYEEFTKRLNTRTIDNTDYKTYIEPVYCAIDGITKDFAAIMFETCGLSIFKGLLPYANKLLEQEQKVLQLKQKLAEETNKLKDMK